MSFALGKEVKRRLAQTDGAGSLVRLPKRRMKKVRGVGRNAAHHYDPVTGRKRPEKPS